jgi:hypothetical protein
MTPCYERASHEAPPVICGKALTMDPLLRTGLRTCAAAPAKLLDVNNNLEKNNQPCFFY